MKIEKINIEEVKRDIEYKNTIKDFYKTLENFKTEIKNILQAGGFFERNYSIRKHAESEEEEIKYIYELAKIKEEQYKIMYQKLIELQTENLMLKKALKNNDIQIIEE